MYLIKTKGAGEIADYIQLRDDNFALITYLQENKIDLILRRLSLEKYIEAVKNSVENLEVGIVKKIE